MNTPTPRIYFADVEAYNNGRLRGVWVDFFKGIQPDDVRAAIAYLFEWTDKEEWRIDDTEDFAGFSGCDLERLCEVADLIHQHGEEPVKGYFANRGDDTDLSEFESYYMGCFESETDFCEEIFDVATQAEKIQVFSWATLDQYIDWSAIAVDAFINSYWSHQVGHKEIYVYAR